MKHICNFCGKEFQSNQELGGHVSRCQKNPNYERNKESIKKAKIKNIV